VNAPPTARPRPPLVAITLALAVGLVDAALLALGMGGVRALLARPPALALLAVWVLGGARLALSRPAGAQDLIERPRGQGLLLVALLVIPLFTPMLCAFAARAGVALLPGGDAARWTGVVLVAAGLAVRVAAMGRLGSRFAPVVALQRTHALETRGLYAWVRHPGYIGALIAQVGAVLALGSAAGFAPALAFALALEARVRAEERLLARHFGAAWTEYAARTGRWLPRPGGSR
jgi:protein-S-isoprenylcysteine O-methyltransferase